MCLNMCDGGGIIPATLTDLGHSTGRGSAPFTSCPTEPFVAWIAATEKENQVKVEIRKKKDLKLEDCFQLEAIYNLTGTN